MSDFQGIIIEESLENKDILKRVKILSTRISKVTDRHQTPWISQWTVHTVEVQESGAQSLAEEISKSLDESHNSSWYVDFKDDFHHYIIFPDKVFYIDRQSKQQYDEAKSYGISLGIPEYQLPFHPEVQE
ncbi:MAG TPA: hypothetical protein G4O18_08145 [Dehalococcoidia bacterium]|nr:hypothetical protein [Dehalococcoidia bacterium]